VQSKIVMLSLEAIYEEIRSPAVYKKAVKKRIAKIVLGASVIRAFTKDTKPGLLSCLINLDVDSLPQINSVEQYDLWHATKITFVYNCLLKTNAGKFTRGLEGLQWGHTTKVFNLYIGHLYFYSPYFESVKRKSKVHRFLHVPLDSKVFKVLRQSDIEVPKSIKTINAALYSNIQESLRLSAQKMEVDPLRFDDYAWADAD
jgi:hypothetical protein